MGKNKVFIAGGCNHYGFSTDAYIWNVCTTGGEMKQITDDSGVKMASSYYPTWVENDEVISISLLDHKIYSFSENKWVFIAGPLK
jgi:hypothetical protein